jgi:hypothetical protein
MIHRIEEQEDRIRQLQQELEEREYSEVGSWQI